MFDREMAGGRNSARWCRGSRDSAPAAHRDRCRARARAAATGTARSPRPARARRDAPRPSRAPAGRSAGRRASRAAPARSPTAARDFAAGRRSHQALRLLARLAGEAEGVRIERAGTERREHDRRQLAPRLAALRDGLERAAQIDGRQRRAHRRAGKRRCANSRAVRPSASMAQSCRNANAGPVVAQLRQSGLAMRSVIVAFRTRPYNSPGSDWGYAPPLRFGTFKRFNDASSRSRPRSSPRRPARRGS